MPHRVYDCPDCLRGLTGLRDCYVVRIRIVCQPAKYVEYTLPGLMSTAFTTVAQKCNTWRLDQLATNYHLNLSVLFDPFAA